MTKKTETLYFLVVSGVLWTYLIYKAVVSPLVMDEATTFLEYANLWDVLPGQANWRTNNHYLNSVLVALSSSVFGINEWVLRLPNLLSFLVFARCTWLWNQQIQNKLLRLIFPLTVFGSLFYMEFFGLARGYGLSLAALYGGAYHQYKGLVENSKKDKNLSFLFMILAIMANLNMQFIYLVWFAIEFWDRRKTLKSSWWYLAVRLIPILATVVVSFILKSKGSLDSGHDLGLLETFRALLFVASFRWDFWWWSVPIFLSFAVLLALILRFKRLQIKWEAFDVLLILLLGNIAVILVNHVILGVSYPNQRLAMHWFLLWLPLVFLASNYFNLIGRYFIIGGAIVLLGFQFNYWQHSFNLDRNSDGIWRQEQIENTFALGLSEMRDPEITLSGTFYHHRQWAYLQMKNDAYFPLRMQHSLFKDTLADFLLVKSGEISEHPMYEKYRGDRHGYLSLLRRKSLLKKKTVGRVDFDDFELIRNGKVLLERFDYPAKDKQVGLRLEFNMHADEAKFKSSLDVLVKNENGFKYWESFRLDKLYANLKNRKVVLNVIVPSHNEDDLSFSLNIVNIDGVKCRIDKARCYFYELE